MPSSHARNIALTPELNAYVDDLVSSGAYANASEVMRAGLRALKDRHGLDEISTRIITALDRLDRGEGMRGDPAEVLGRVLEAARNRHIR